MIDWQRKLRIFAFVDTKLDAGQSFQSAPFDLDAEMSDVRTLLRQLRRARYVERASLIDVRTGEVLASLLSSAALAARAQPTRSPRRSGSRPARSHRRRAASPRR